MEQSTRDLKLGIIYIPVNFTHVADMDGLGCAFLTKVAFNNVSKKMDELDVDLQRTVRRCGNNYIVDPIIVPLGYKEPEKRIMEAFEVVNNIRRNVQNPTVPIIIYTDVTEPKNMQELLQTLDCYNEEGVVHWYFDHHATNPKHKTTNISVRGFDLMPGLCIPKIATIIDKEATPTGIINHMAYKYIMSEDMEEILDNVVTKKHAENIWNEMDRIFSPFSDSGVDRSATFIYYIFLCMIGMLYMDTQKLSNEVICILNHFVYYVSMADTYWFDNVLSDTGKGIPYPLREPTDPSDKPVMCWDYYSVWFKTSASFYRKLTALEDGFYASVRQFRNGIEKESPSDAWSLCIPDINSYEGEYAWAKPTIPDMKKYILPPIEIVMANKACYERDGSYKKVVAGGCKLVSFPQLYEVEGKMCVTYINDTALVVCDGDNIDISYIGNRLCKEYPVAMSVFLYAGTRSLSFRSKNTGMDVSRVAKAYGGGGHVHAAGAYVIPDVIIELLKAYWESDRTPDSLVDNAE